MGSKEPENIGYFERTKLMADLEYERNKRKTHQIGLGFGAGMSLTAVLLNADFTLIAVGAAIAIFCAAWLYTTKEDKA